MLGMIGFEAHSIRCTIGCEAEEQQKEQEIFVDLKVKTDLTLGIQSDEIANTLSYVSLSNICTEIATNKHYHLIETYAYTVMQKILKEHKVAWIWIRVRKPKALPNAQCAFVELTGGSL